MSGSRRARLIVAVMMAIAGAVFFYEFFRDDMANLSESAQADVSSALVIRYLVALAIGGAVAGAITAGLFGRNGVAGWAVAFLGAVLASLLTGLIGSAIGRFPDLIADGFGLNDVVAIGFGLVLIPLSMVDRPTLFAAWLVLMVATHLWARSARRAGA